MKASGSEKGTTSVGQVLDLLLKSDVAVPSGSEPQANGAGLDPLVFDKDGTKMVAVFTSLARVTQRTDMRFVLTLRGRDLLARMPRGLGIVVNPGFTVGFEITPSAIADLLREGVGRTAVASTTVAGETNAGKTKK
jgi:hypothetical protein